MEIRVGGCDSNDYDNEYQACARIAACCCHSDALCRMITFSDMLFNHVQNLP